MADSLLGTAHLPAVESYLGRYLGGHEASFNAEMSRYHFSTGGKRLRALIPGWVFQACGEAAERATPLGCALEMVHNATLVHDDLQDGDDTRRGKATVWKNWSPAQAINCGDAMFEFSVELLTELDVEPARQIRVIRRVTRGVLQVIEGQAQEFVMKDESFPTLERYLGVVRGKTAALIATSVGSALMALGKPDEVIAAAEDAAMLAGLVFQLQDDLLDLYGDKGRDRVGSDIAEGKVSALVAVLNERTDTKDREQVGEILRKPREATSDEEIRLVLEIFERTGTKAKVVTELRERLEALHHHPLAGLEPKVHQMLVALGDLFLAPIRGVVF